MKKYIEGTFLTSVWFLITDGKSIISQKQKEVITMDWGLKRFWIMFDFMIELMASSHLTANKAGIINQKLSNKK